MKILSFPCSRPPSPWVRRCYSMMLIGACVGFIAGNSFGSPWAGVAAAVVAGALLALIHAFLTVTLRANQVVSGLAVTLFGTGLSG